MQRRHWKLLLALITLFAAVPCLVASRAGATMVLALSAAFVLARDFGGSLSEAQQHALLAELAHRRLNSVPQRALQGTSWPSALFVESTTSQRSFVLLLRRESTDPIWRSLQAGLRLQRVKQADEVSSEQLRNMIRSR